MSVKGTGNAPTTTRTHLLARADRERLADAGEQELVRLDRVAALMRQVPAQMGPPVPPALHIMARHTITERETSS
jgi:hypothetical protein